MQLPITNISYPILSRNEWQDLLQQIGWADTTYRQDVHIPTKGFPIVTREAVEFLANMIGREEAFEVGAGVGYLARLLSDQGVNIRAIDSRKGHSTRAEWWENPLYFNVEEIDHNTLDVFPGRYVIMTWPCYDTDFALEVARKIQPGQFLIYQGDGQGGCTANKEFFLYLKDKTLEHRFRLCGNTDDLNDLSVNFFSQTDWWWIYYRE